MRKKVLIIVLAIVVIIAVGLVVWQFGAKNDAQNTVGQTNLPPSTAVAVKARLNNLAFDKAASTTDPFGDKNGPYFHKVYGVTGSDSLIFNGPKKIILDHASVPDAIRQQNGDIYVYGVDGAQRSNSGIFVSVSQDNGTTWRSGSLKISSSRTKFSIGADPQIVALTDGTFRLYYMVNEKPMTPGVFDPTAKNKIMSAVSADGLNFTEEKGTRFEDAQITDPDVIKIGSRWLMYLAQGPKQIVATSADGLTFTYKDAVRDHGSVSKTVAIDSTTYRQYFCKDGISSATTTDGLKFTTDAGLRLAPASGEMLCDPSPVKMSQNWLLVYKTRSL